MALCNLNRFRIINVTMMSTKTMKRPGSSQTKHSSSTKMILSQFTVITIIVGLLCCTPTVSGWELISQVLSSNDPASPYREMFGTAVAQDGDYFVVGAFGDRTNGQLAGAAFVYRYDSESKMFVHDGDLRAEDGNDRDRFGIAVGIYGTTAVVGAYFDEDKGDRSGSAYVFDRVGPGEWVQTQKLTASDAAIDHFYGVNVGIWGDTIVIGAYKHDFSETIIGSGAAYVYTKTGTGDAPWEEKTRLVPRNVQSGDNFGVSVAIYEDLIVCGADYDSENGNRTGAAYVFTRREGEWEETAKLLADDGNPFDDFGYAVDVWGDTVIVGAYRHEPDPENDTKEGAAYIFQVDSNGVWSQSLKLTANEQTPGAEFGRHVAIWRGIVVVGAHLEEAVYVFQRSEDGTWTNEAQQRIAAPDPPSGEYFGFAFDIYGNKMAVGAYLHRRGEPPAPTGIVYVYTDLAIDVSDPTTSPGATNPPEATNPPGASDPPGTTDPPGPTNPPGTFIEPEYLFLQPRGAASNRFGTSVSKNENFAVFGAPLKDAGVAYAYRYDSMVNQWFFESTLIQPMDHSYSGFGSAVAMTNDETAVIGAFYRVRSDRAQYTSSGESGTAAHSFEWDDAVGQWTLRQTWFLPNTISRAPTDDDRLSISVWNDMVALAGMGAVGIYRKNAEGVWAEEAAIKVSALPDESSDPILMTVALHQNRLVCSSADGLVYVYSRSSTSTSVTWEQEATLLADDYSAGDLFGNALATDGLTILVGASRHSGSGAAYVFRLQDSWIQVAKLTAADSKSGDQFGFSVSIDAEVAVVGAPISEKVYIFPRSGDVRFGEEFTLTTTNPGTASMFGMSLSKDNRSLLIGAPLHIRREGVPAGTVFLFVLPDLDFALPSGRNKGCLSLSAVTSLTPDTSDLSPFSGVVFEAVSNGEFELVTMELALFVPLSELSDDLIVHVYTRVGSHPPPNATNLSHWNTIASSNLIALTEGAIIPTTNFKALTWRAHERRTFYISLQKPVLGSVGNSTADTGEIPMSSTDMDIFVGVGYREPFSTEWIPNVQFSGKFHLRKFNDCSVATRTTLVEYDFVLDQNASEDVLNLTRQQVEKFVWNWMLYDPISISLQDDFDLQKVGATEVTKHEFKGKQGSSFLYV